MKGQFASETSEAGEFKRQEDAFREWIGEGKAFPAEAGRYHLYISLACPWASRTLIVRKLKGLEDAIGITVLDPFRDERGWAFRDPERIQAGSSLEDIDNFEPTDPVNGFKYLREAYLASDPNFLERVTVPVLWDKTAKRIVNNCEDDICPMFNDAFNLVAAKPEVNLFPADLAAEQAKLSDFVYENINNGVYRAGFAVRQRAYERACGRLFDALDEMEKRLAKSRFLFGPRIVETDWRLFCTLIRFDPVYHGHFKCNLRRIFDYPNLQGYLLDLYQQPGIAETVNISHIKRHYYMTHEGINPTRIVPVGPALDLNRPHGRGALA